MTIRRKKHLRCLLLVKAFDMIIHDIFVYFALYYFPGAVNMIRVLLSEIVACDVEQKHLLMDVSWTLALHYVHTSLSPYKATLPISYLR